MTRFHRSLAIAALVAPAFLGAQGMDMSGAGSSTTVSGYGDVSYKSRRDNARPGFDYGAFDLYIASMLAPKVQFGAELVFERVDGNLSPDLERLFIAYNWRPELKIAVGRFHTPVGYWNTSFHHGAFMQPIIDRPALFEYEDGDGVLPLHSIGTMISGRNIGGAHFGYDISIGAPLRADASVGDTKPIMAAGQLQLEPVPDFVFGASASLVKRAAGSLTQLTGAGATLANDLTQQSAGLFAAHFGAKTEYVVEQQWITHTTDGGASVTTSGGYVYGGLRFDDVIPYAFAQTLKTGAGDVYLAQQDVQQGAIGARWEISAKASWRVEGRYERRLDGTKGFVYGSQFAFAF
jgi:hypothetical protein